MIESASTRRDPKRVDSSVGAKRRVWFGPVSRELSWAWVVATARCLLVCAAAALVACAAQPPAQAPTAPPGVCKGGDCLDEMEQEALAAELELQGMSMGASLLDCARARSLSSRVCELSERICGLTERSGELGGRCEDARARCERVARMVDESCGETTDGTPRR